MNLFAQVNYTIEEPDLVLVDIAFSVTNFLINLHFFTENRSNYKTTLNSTIFFYTLKDFAYKTFIVV